jgi:hypothetical protein
MKNYIQLFVSALIISIFWFVIYLFADHILAAYLAVVFGIITAAVACWIVVKAVLIITIMTNKTYHKTQKTTFAQKKMYDPISETA